MRWSPQKETHKLPLLQKATNMLLIASKATYMFTGVKALFNHESLTQSDKAAAT